MKFARSIVNYKVILTLYRFKDPDEAYRESRNYNRRDKFADFPPYVTFELVSGCNFKCTMCPASYLKKGKKEFDLRLFKGSIDEIARYGSLIRFIGYCEPLLHSKIKDAISYVKEKKLLLQITTNGSLLDEKMVKAIAGAGVDIVIFSFQGLTKGEYCLMRNVPPGVYSKVVDSIKLLYKGRISGKPYIKITTTITSRDKPADRSKFIDMHSSYSDEVQVTGGTHFVFLEKFSGAKELGSKLKLDRPELVEKIECFIPNYEMKIIENGDVYVCCGALSDDLRIGNIEKHSLFDLWHSARAKDIREALSGGDLTKFKDCSVCPIRYSYDNMGNIVSDTIKKGL